MKQRGRIDISIFLISLGLMLFSLIVVYSASSAVSSNLYQGNSDKMFSLHLMKVLLAVIVLFAFSRIPFDNFKKFTGYVLYFSLALLVLTIMMGILTKGATRRLEVGGLGFMASDFARFALILRLGVLIEEKGDRIKDFKRGFLELSGWIVLCVLLILKQPNFSTAMIISIVGISMLYVGGTKTKYILNTILILIPLAIIVIYSATYRTERFSTYIESLVTGEPVNSQVAQAMIGFGSGNINGLGMGQSLQKNFFLPEAYGDFIFAVIGEEYGFIGTMLIMSVYLFVVYMGFRVAKKSKNKFHSLIAFGFTLSFGLYAFINAAVTLGIFPTTGITLPFLSYGGSSLITNAAGIGLILNISSINNYETEIINTPTKLYEEPNI